MHLNNLKIKPIDQRKVPCNAQLSLFVGTTSGRIKFYLDFVYICYINAHSTNRVLQLIASEYKHKQLYAEVVEY